MLRVGTVPMCVRMLRLHQLPVVRMAVFEIFQVVQRLFSVEKTDVTSLSRRQTPYRPAEVDEMRLYRCVHRMHPDLIRQTVRLARIAGAARGDDVGPLVGSAA